MAKEIKSEKVNEIEIKATPRAFEQLKEIVNGSREKVNEFIENISKVGINREDYQIFLKNASDTFYYHKCKNMYVVFVIGKGEVTLVEFLTETEFNEIRSKKQ